jgi:hypothetical protein
VFVENNDFTKWMGQVDAILERLTGLTSDFLPDCNYWDWFDDGNKPEVAALMAMEEVFRF